MYDVSKLKADVFQKVLKYITDNLKGQEPPPIPMRDVKLPSKGSSPRDKAESRQDVVPIQETSMEQFPESKPHSPYGGKAAQLNKNI